MNKLILGSITALGLAAAAVPAVAGSRVDFYLNVAPPPVYHEVVPAPRAGFVWVPGFWDWRHGREYWVAGHWVRHRPAYGHYPTRWHPHHHRHPHRGWRDADRDGVPNRYDAAPYDPRWR